MQLEHALPLLRAGNRMVRGEWEVGTFVYLVPAASYPAQRGAAKAWAGENAMIPYSEYLAFSAKTGLVSPYEPNQRDLLAADWELMETWNGHR